jgi:hypothetical protein
MGGLSDKIIIDNSDLNDKLRKEDVKEAIKNIRFNLLKKYKIASIPIMKVIEDEFGKELCS